MEYLLTTPRNKFTLFPIKHNDIWKMYEEHQSVLWVANEIDFEADLPHWRNTLNEDERHFIKNVLAFFAASDGIVNENLVENFQKEIQLIEAKSFYSIQNFMETVHNHSYSLMIDTYINDNEEKDRLFNAIYTIDSVKKKSEFAVNWIKSDNFVERLVAFACVEGILFSGSFCSIFWLKKRGLMPGLSQANEFISRDEGLHTDFACLLYRNYVQNKLTEQRVHDIIKQSMEVEKAFIIDSIPVSLIGMNSNLMIQYLELVADRLAVALGYNKIYNSENPFPFMDMINLERKTNFFENRPTEYMKAGSGGKKKAFELTEDF